MTVSNRPFKIVPLDVFGRMKDVVFIDDRTNNESDLEMHPSERNEAPMVVGVDESSKSSLSDLGEDIDERKE